MKHHFSFLLLLLALLCGSASPPAQAQVAIFHANTSAQPGEALSIQGQFSATAQGFLSLGTSSSGQRLPVLAQSAGQMTVQVPNSLSADVYQVWVVDGGQRSPSVYVNQARGMHFDSPEITSGGTFRIFGRNLRLNGSSPQVRLVARNGGSSGTAQVQDGDAYSLRLTAPGNLTAGQDYDVYVSNGRGGTAGETKIDQPLTAISGGGDYFQLGVAWGAKFDFYQNVYDVRTDSRLARKATGDGNTNDLPALQAAIDRAAADGGGVVRLPAGNYKLTPAWGGGLFMRNRVVVQGVGKDQTFIKYGYGSVTGGTGVIWENPKQAGLADLSLVNVNESGQWINNSWGKGTEIFLQRVRMDLNRGSWLTLTNSNKVAIVNSEITQGVDDLNNYHGPLQLDNTNNFVVAHNTITYVVDGISMNHVRNGVFEDNQVNRNCGIWYPSNIITHVLIANFAQDFAVLNNQVKTINGTPQDNNDGEAIISEGGGNYGPRTDEDAGSVSSASGNSLQDYSKNWQAPTWNPVVTIVKGPGTGQWRTITSRQGNSLTVDRPWDVTPTSASRYAMFNWGAREWLVMGNTFTGHRRGITLYQNATTDVALVNNTLTNSGAIDLSPWQADNSANGVPQEVLPMYDTQVIGNTVSGTDPSSNVVYIGVHVVQYMQTRTFGTTVIGLEVRRNTLNAHTNKTYSSKDDGFAEGFLNELNFQQGSNNYEDEGVPGVLGSIFQDNTASNCANAMYLTSGSYNTVICNLQTNNCARALYDKRFPGLQHGSVGTSSCLDQPNVSLRTPENPASIAAGLDYSYYEGFWSQLPDFNSLTAVKTGNVADFSLGMRQRDYGYAVKYSGYITVPTDGEYSFTLNADDGANLYVGSTLVVNNNGSHREQQQSGTIGLKAGTHAFSVAYFQNGGDQVVGVTYFGPGQAQQVLPASLLSHATSQQQATLRTPENPSGTTAGLDYKYIEGNWSQLPDFNNQTAVKTGTTGEILLNMRQRDNGYAVQYTGYITVPTDGQYTFFTSSDDGSKLYIGSTQVVDNDGVHGVTEQSGTIGLKAGTHAFTVSYFQGTGGQTFNVSYRGPNIAKQLIPSSAFVRGSGGTPVTSTPSAPINTSGLRVPENPAGAVAGLDYNYYEGYWSQLPDFNNLSAVKAGTTGDVLLNMRQRDYGYAVKYTGYITVPADGQYTFYTSSDDGSKVYIGSTQVVDNDGTHNATTERSGTIGLQAGTHAFTITYFQSGGGQTLNVNYQGPGVSKQGVINALRRVPGSSPTILANSSGLRVPENPAGAVAGLDYKYYEGYWTQLPDFNSLPAVKAGTSSDVLLNMRQRDYGYAVKYTGYVTVPADGQYTFFTSSDDGSKFYIGSTQVVDNDGTHNATTERAGTIGLQAGTHAFTITYFQSGGGQTLNVSYQGPGVSKQGIVGALRRVPGSSLAGTATQASAVAATTTSVGPGMEVYPNPNQGAFVVTYSSEVAQTATLTLTDGVGRAVQTQKVQLQTGANQLPVTGRNLAQGIYQLTLLGANGQREVKKVSINP